MFYNVKNYLVGVNPIRFACLRHAQLRAIRELYERRALWRALQNYVIWCGTYKFSEG
jgi:hypothetical protein